MESLEEIKARVEEAVAGARVEIIPNPGPTAKTLREVAVRPRNSGTWLGVGVRENT